MHIEFILNFKVSVTSQESVLHLYNSFFNIKNGFTRTALPYFVDTRRQGP